MSSSVWEDLGGLPMVSCEVCIGTGMVLVLVWHQSFCRGTVACLKHQHGSWFSIWKEAIRPIPKEDTYFCLSSLNGWPKSLLRSLVSSFFPLFSWMSRCSIKTSLTMILTVAPWTCFGFITQLCSAHRTAVVRKGEARWHYGPKRSCAASEQGEAVQVSWSKKPREFHR